jgi:nucleoside-diphosphate-sugar epimerase
MRVLFIGGTGVISSSCAELALARGIHLTLLNRGRSSTHPVPDGAEVVHADIRDRGAAEAALAGRTFDAVVDWVAYKPEHVEADIELFRGRTGQYVFISSASAYQKPPSSLPITEATLLDNPFWQYSRDKIACEERLVRAFREEKFPYTIIRPSHTYDQTKVPAAGGWTSVHRLRQGKAVVVPGDGTSLWVLTHSRDLAKGLVGLLGNARAIADAFHITSDEWLDWNQIYATLARAAGAELRMVHVPSTVIIRYHAQWGGGLLGDKTYCAIFDNSKIKRFVPGFAATTPFSEGAREIIAWYDADPARQVVNEEYDRVMDELIARMSRFDQ